jgi:hypothetical protein
MSIHHWNPQSQVVLTLSVSALRAYSKLSNHLLNRPKTEELSGTELQKPLG